jgi:hypothetical protein
LGWPANRLDLFKKDRQIRLVDRSADGERSLDHIVANGAEAK